MLQGNFFAKKIVYTKHLTFQHKVVLQMIIAKIRLFQTTSIFFVALITTGMLMLSSCSSDDTTGPQSQQISVIVISPENASIEVGEQLEFSAFALTASGDTVDTAELDIEWQWWSNDPEVFTVEENGVATGHSPGEAYCVIEAIVDVSLNLDTQQDVPIAVAGLTSEKLTGTLPGHQDLSAGNQVIFDLSNVEFISNVEFKSRLRFTGRDSAFVMVF